MFNYIKRLFPTRATSSRAKSPTFESLEERRLLTALTVRSAWADNRGYASLVFSTGITTKTLAKNAVVAYTAGKDGKFGTKDDVRKVVRLVYTAKTRTLTVQVTGLAVNSSYLIRLYGAKIKASDGTELSGKFSGKFPTTGGAGSNFSFVSRPTKGNPTARFLTSLGTMDVTLYQDQVANTVKNFLKYANAGLYDSTIIHRRSNVSTEKISIIQGGGFSTTIDSSGYPTGIQTFTPIPLQASLSNLAGTIGVARGSDVNSGTSQWYFNVTDNRILNPRSTNDGYAVFGKITTTAGMAVANAIFALQTVDLTPLDPYSAVTTVPVIKSKPRTYVVVSRVSILDKISTK